MNERPEAAENDGFIRSGLDDDSGGLLPQFGAHYNSRAADNVQIKAQIGPEWVFHKDSPFLIMSPFCVC